MSRMQCIAWPTAGAFRVLHLACAVSGAGKSAHRDILLGEADVSAAIDGALAFITTAVFVAGFFLFLVRRLGRGLPCDTRINGR